MRYPYVTLCAALKSVVCQPPVLENNMTVPGLLVHYMKTPACGVKKMVAVLGDKLEYPADFGGVEGCVNLSVSHEEDAGAGPNPEPAVGVRTQGGYAVIAELIAPGIHLEITPVVPVKAPDCTQPEISVLPEGKGVDGGVGELVLDGLLFNGGERSHTDKEEEQGKESFFHDGRGFPLQI
jgi:hypothetical protein